MEMCMIAEVYGVSFDFIHDICVDSISNALHIHRALVVRSSLLLSLRLSIEMKFERHVA